MVHLLHDLTFELQAGRVRVEPRGILGHGKGHGHLALELVGHAHHRHFGNVGVRCNALLDFAGAQAVASDVDHVVRAAQDEVVAVSVTNPPVKRAVQQTAGDALPVGVDEACVIAPHGLHATGWQRAFNAHHALLVGAGQLFASGLVHDLHRIAVHGLARAAEARGLLLHTVGQGQNRPASFGLPVVVDDGHSQRVADPLRCGFVQGLSRQPQGLEAGDIVFLEPAGVLLLEHTHGRGGREHVRDLVLFHNAPPHTSVRASGQAFVHDGGHARDERAVDDVAVPHHPADVAGGEVGLAGLRIKNMLHAGSQRHGVAAGVALHALGLAGGAAGVQRVAGVRGLHPFARHAGVQMLFAQAGPVVVAPGLPVHGGEPPVDHQHSGRLVGRQGNGFVQQGLVRHHLAAARTGIGTDHHHGLCVFNAGRQ